MNNRDLNPMGQEGTRRGDIADIVVMVVLETLKLAWLVLWVIFPVLVYCYVSVGWAFTALLPWTLLWSALFVSVVDKRSEQRASSSRRERDELTARVKRLEAELDALRALAESAKGQQSSAAGRAGCGWLGR